MQSDLIDFFDRRILEKARIKIDKNLLIKIRNFRFDWGNKEEHYIEFLTTGLIGIQPIRFSLRDETILFKDILRVDYKELQYDVYKIPGINKDFKVSSNIVNLTLVYLMHKFWTSSLPEKDRIDAMEELYQIFAYKQIGSIYSHYFTYALDHNVAQSVFEKLSNQYLLKKLGSWEELFKYQAKLLLPPNGNNKDRIKTLSVEEAVNTINDMRNRITSVVKNVVAVLYEFLESNEAKIKSNSLLGVNDDGSQAFLDVSDNNMMYINTVKSSYNNVNDFVIEDLVYVVRSMFPNIKEDKFNEALYYLVSVEPSRVKEFDYITAIIRQSLSYLRTRGIVNNYRKRAGDCLSKLKGYFSASKVKDADVVESKKVLEVLVHNALGTKTKWIITPIVIGICLYIFLRSICDRDNLK